MYFLSTLFGIFLAKTVNRDMRLVTRGFHFHGVEFCTIRKQKIHFIVILAVFTKKCMIE